MEVFFNNTLYREPKHHGAQQLKNQNYLIS